MPAIQMQVIRKDQANDPVTQTVMTKNRRARTHINEPFEF